MKLIKGLLLSALMFGAAAKADVPSIHGMLLFGDKITYASHLPMFHAPHDYQVILKLTLEDHPTHSRTVQLYEQAKADGETFFTLVPEKMDLSKIVSGEKKQFIAQIFIGHFERGGQKIDGSGAIVNVESVILGEKLNAAAPQVDQKSYWVFGEQGEYYAAHLIQSKPSFDQILKVTQPTTVVIPRGRCTRAGCPEPILVPVADKDLPVNLQSKTSEPLVNEQLIGTEFGMSTTVVNQLYLEIDELSH